MNYMNTKLKIQNEQVRFYKIKIKKRTRLDFIKEKEKLGPLDKKLKKYVWQLVNLNQGSFIFKNYEFQKYTLFIKENTPFTQLNSILLLGILDCNAKMGNETAGYYCINF